MLIVNGHFGKTPPGMQDKLGGTAVALAIWGDENQRDVIFKTDPIFIPPSLQEGEGGGGQNLASLHFYKGSILRSPPLNPLLQGGEIFVTPDAVKL